MDTDRPTMFMLMPYVPFPVDRGAYQRVYHLFVELSKAFAIDLVCLREAADADRDIGALAAYTCRQTEIRFQHPPWPALFPSRLLHPLPTTVRHWQDDGVLQAIRAFIGARSYAYVYFFDLVMWPYVETLFSHHKRCIMDRSRVDWLFQSEELRTLRLSRTERLLRRENLWKIGRMERKVYRELSGMIVCGWDDKAFLRQHIGDDTKVFVLANGYNPQLFDAIQWPRQLEEQPTVLFCGALDYSPNVDGIEWFLGNIWPRVHAALPQARWRIVGKSPDHRAVKWSQAPGVELVGEVADVRPYYQSSWVQVVPLRIGGGTRLKIVESLAMQCPVISTSLGAQGLELSNGRDILHADSAEAFADALIALLADPARITELGQQGEAAVRRQYHWQQLGSSLIHHLLPANR